MQKIKAFTLMELLIGMIVSGLVVGFCMMAYFIIFKQFNTYKNTKQSISNIVLLHTVIANDFTNAKTIKSTANNNLVLSNGDNNITYRFTNKMLTRVNKETTDTFTVESKNWESVFVMGNDDEKLKIVNKFSFDATVLGEEESFTFTKRYAADVVLGEGVVSY